MTELPSFVCPVCGANSYHPKDKEHGYCGRCLAFTGAKDGMADRGTLIISNLGPGDTTFDSDRGSWNVTRALSDCLKGNFGPPYTFGVSELLGAAANVDIDEAKVTAMLSDKDRLLVSPPLILVEDEGKVWLIDGHHRLQAMSRLGYSELAGYVIDDPERYRVLFNGERIAPWYEGPK